MRRIASGSLLIHPRGELGEFNNAGQLSHPPAPESGWKPAAVPISQLGLLLTGLAAWCYQLAEGSLALDL